MKLKNFIILAGLAVFVSACTTSKKIPVSSRVERLGVVYEIHSDRPFTGIVTNCYLSGQPRTSLEYRDGLKNGQQIEWLENGRKKEVITWRQGVRDGEQLQYYENEHKAFQGWMRQGKWVGECWGWYPDGNRAFQVCFQDGQGKGKNIVIKWNKDNLIREFADVQINGEWIEWHPSGRITRHEKYLNGKLVEKIK